MKVAIGYLTKNRLELTKQTIAPLRNGQHALFWFDGSTDADALEFFKEERENVSTESRPNVKGGADAAIVFALTTMLKHPAEYDVIGLCESDVLLHKDWMAPTIQLFARGESEGLKVGAVSARAYEDRILLQRDGYAVMHNLGAGHICFTRKAAELVLGYYRSGWWTDNRAIFNHLTSLDIGRWGAFRGNTQWLSADWHWDAVLAQNGLASLAITPSPVEMIGQTPPLAEQGLTLATELVEDRRDDKAFEQFASRTRMIRNGKWAPDVIRPIHRSSLTANQIYFAHQMPYPTEFAGDWFLSWTQGFGPFGWRAGKDAHMRASLFGPVAFLVSGGKTGAPCKITDTESGYEIAPTLSPLGEGGNIQQLAVPAGVSYRDITMDLGEGGIFYGIQMSEPQPTSSETFDFSKLPPVE